MSSVQSGRSGVEVDGPLSLNWTFLTSETGRICIKLDGPKDSEWKVCKMITLCCINYARPLLPLWTVHFRPDFEYFDRSIWNITVQFQSFRPSSLIPMDRLLRPQTVHFGLDPPILPLWSPKFGPSTLDLTPFIITHRSVGSRLELNRFGIRWWWLFWGCLWRNEPMLMDLSLRFSWIWMTRPATVVVAVVAINKDPNLISLKNK